VFELEKVNIIADAYLDKRDKIRSSVFRTLGFGTEQYRTDVDTEYNARDRDLNSSQGQRAFVTATMILRDEVALITSIPNLKEHLLRAHFSTAAIAGPKGLIHPTSLQYDSKWLNEPSNRLRELWCSLHKSLSHSPRKYNRFSIMAWLSTSAYAKSADMTAIQALIAFYRTRDFAEIEVPAHSSFELSYGYAWNGAEILALSSTKSFEDSSEARLPKKDHETEYQHMSRIENLFQDRQRDAMHSFAAELKKQWPCQQPNTPSSTEIDAYLNTSKMMSSVENKFNNWYKNKCFMEYLQKVSDLIVRQPVSKAPTPHYSLTKVVKKSTTEIKDLFFDMGKFFAQIPPLKFQHGTDLCEPKLKQLQPVLRATNNAMQQRLDRLCQDLESYAKSKCERAYVESLRTSCASLEKEDVNTRAPNFLTDGIHTKEIFQSYLLDCKGHFADLNLALDNVLANDIRPSDCIATKIKQSPRSSPTFWLSYLNLERHNTLSEAWKAAFIEYGLAVTHLHRAQRLVALSDKPAADLAEELCQRGHTNWIPAEHPETLLLEAESGIIVRAVQATIAEQMRQPPNSRNTVMQLNMGEGKSSTICPIVAAALADTKR
jgi:hypothetical protein